MDEKQSTKYGFYDEFNVKNRNTQYQPLSQIISDTAHKTCNQCTTKLTPSKSCCNRSNLFKVFPILQWLSSYELLWFKQDFIAGITVSILLVPQSLAYATLAGLPPEWGLYAAITPVFLYIIFGTSTRIAIGPVAPTAIMVASAVEVIAGTGDSETDIEYALKYETIAMSLSFVCGVILLLFGIFRIGFITVFLSNPVMAGFIMSAASIILAEQFRSLLGLDIPRSPLFYKTLQNVFNSIDDIHGYTALVSIISLFFLYLPKWFPQKIPKWVPMPLFVIIGMVLTSWILDLKSHGVNIVGNEIKTGFPIPNVPDFGYFVELIPGGLVIAIVSYMGSIALAKGFDQKGREEHKNKLEIYNDYINDPFVTKPLANTDTKSSIKTPTTPLLHDKNQSIVELSMSIHHTAPIPNSLHEFTSILEKDNFAEMSSKKKEDVIPEKPLNLPSIELNPDTEFIAFGIANVIGSFFGAQVISASFSRSGLNNDMRGHTQMSSVLQATVCLLCLSFLMPLLAPLPNAVLASVVAISVHRLIKNGILQFIFLWNVSRIELIEFMAALIAPWIVGLEIGIFIAIGVSIIVSLIRHTFINIIQLGQLKTNGLSDNNEYVDVEIFHQANFVENIVILEIKSELSFANSRKLIDKIRELLNDEKRFIIISLGLTQIMDTTSIGEIVTLFGDAKGSYIAFTNCRPDIIEIIKRFEAIKKTFPHNIKMFISTDDAVLYFKSLMKNDDKTPKRGDLTRTYYDDDHIFSSLTYAFST